MTTPRFSSLVCLLLMVCGLVPMVPAEAAGRPAYETEQWPEARVLIWANPGQHGDLAEASNWRVQGGGVAKTAPDRETDVYLPAGDKPYMVSGGRVNQVRHVVIERNAVLAGGHRNEVEIWGNCHVKAGGFAKYISIRGAKHTFFRVDGSEYPSPQNQKIYNHPTRRVNFEQRCPGHLSHKFQVGKMGIASVEFIGNLGVSDEVMVQSGKMIVNGEFRFSGATNKGALEIYDGGILELQSGSRVATFEPTNRKAVYNVNVYRNGTLQAGSPERPLTQDAYLALGFGENDKPGRTGLYMALGSMLRVHTTDPKRARLVVTSMISIPDMHKGNGDRQPLENQKAKGNVGVAMQLAGDVRLNGVHFDYIAEGGIGLPGGVQPDDWQNVTWGEHVAAAPAELFSELAVNPNAYYHGRGDQKSEYGLTTRAMAEMRKFLEDNDAFRMAALPENTTVVEVGKGKNAIQTPVAKVFDQPIQVTLKTRVPGARIRYTTDGSEPTNTSPAYTGPIQLTDTTRIMAKAFKPGVGFSPVFTTTYVFE